MLRARNCRLAAGLVLLLAGTSRAQPAAGDANADGIVDTRDIGTAASHILGLTPASGAPDCNADSGVDALDLFCILNKLPTQIAQTSPLNGEQDVALTRETILRFSNPLDAATVTSGAVKAEFGGQQLGTRLYVSKDRKAVTLFHDAALPASARVRVTVDGRLLRDSQGRSVDADADYVDGGMGFVDFDTLTLTTVPGTAVCGRVFASELAQGSRESVNVPLQGATITVDGQEQTLRATTDANGDFRLEPAPAGRFFVHVDGRTATNGVPPGTYYPYVGKAWDSAPGKETNVGNIYLPLVPAGTLRPASATQDTRVEFVPSVLAGHPEFQGVAVTVPADSLFADDGTRGGQVGIAPVPPDRLPGQLPPGLEFPLVITVQTDGATNFDRPAPACFPNLPEPATGQIAPAGTKNALYSFNHDTGHFEAVGSMTVADDERLVCTDPGIGILAPGWHATGPPPIGPPPPPPPRTAPECPDSRSPREECECEHPKIKKCDDDCLFRFAGCFRGCGDALGKAFAGCLEKTGKALKDCVAKETEKYGKCKVQCVKELQSCFDACDPNKRCPDPQPERRQGRATDPVLVQIDQRLDQIASLLYPHAVSDLEQFPPEVEAQAKALWAGTNALAGGDAAGYLREAALRAEEDLTPFEAEFGETRGAVPPAGVLYLAEALRTDGPFLLRGTTAPLGLYSLFVPRDGALLDVILYDPRTRSYGIAQPRQKLNSLFRMRRFSLFPVDDTFTDSDNDGLADVVELIYATKTGSSDTDGDGVQDGAEVDQGTDPLDGLAAQTGVIASADTPGTAVDVCALNDLVAVADSEAGVSVFNVFNGMRPTIIAQVDTPGDARRVACTTGRIAVADGSAGLAVVDIADPPAASIAHQIQLGSAATAVVAAGDIAYVGTAGGRVAAVDLQRGAVLGHALAGSEVHDLAIEGETLLVALAGQLRAYALVPDFPSLLGTAEPLSYFADPNLGRRRLYAGGGLAYVTSYPGYDTFAVGNPAAMQRIGSARDNGTFNSFKQIVANGSGLGVAAVGVAALNDGTHHVSLYDTSDPAQTDVFLTTLQTPGTARAVSIYNGLAHVADGSAGLQAVNYLAYDAQGAPPAVTLAASFPLVPAALAEEGKRVRVSAAVSDDVQVRNVEFYVDGVKASTDGNFPFEHRFVTPLRVQQASFRIRARASDTGGNAAWSDELTVTLVPDATPPRVLATSPAAGAILGTLDTVTATFNEPIAPATVGLGAFVLFGAGADGAPGTADDVQVPGGSISYRQDLSMALLSFGQSLGSGLYRAVLRDSIADLAGNRLAAEAAWTFRVFDLADRDADGVPDEVEPLLGLDPDNPDTDGDGIRDGDEDFDNDALSNVGEIVLGTDPTRTDTDNDGILDGNEDRDADGLTDGDEIRYGTDPFRTDSDLDGWSDALEVQAGSNPLDPASRPVQVYVAQPPVRLVLPETAEDLPPNVTASRPPVRLVLPETAEDLPPNVTASRPPVRLVLPETAEDLPPNVTAGRPPVSVEFEPSP
jgi:hypothetical protein